jgi:predicted outer membrane protein
MATLSRTLSGLTPEIEAALIAAARSQGRSVSAVAIEAIAKAVLPPVSDRAA